MEHLDHIYILMLVGAIIHYKASKESNFPIGYDSLFLLDSGAQYLDGTTDVTR